MKTKTQIPNESHRRTRKHILGKRGAPSRTKAVAKSTDWIDKVSGIFDGPGDLNTNPKYMEDYGR